jgi:hypothetical protein
MGGLFCVMTYFCFGLVCKVVCKGSKVVLFFSPSYILLIYMGEPREKNMGGKLLFWFSLQGVVKFQKVVIFLSPTCVSHMKRTLGANFCFGFSLQGGLEGSKRVLFFHFHGLVA